MRTAPCGIAVVSLLMLGPASSVADTIGVTPRKLVLIDRTNGGATQKGFFVVKDEVADIHKGPGTDVGNVSAQLDIGFDTLFGPVAGSYPMPAGASDGVLGWLANTDGLAKYKNTTANRHIPNNEVALGVLRPGKLIKVKVKGFGDLGFLGTTIPSGPITTCFTIDNAGSVHRFGSSWPLSACTYRPLPGGAMIACKDGGVPDTSGCPSSPSGAFLDADGSL